MNRIVQLALFAICLVSSSSSTSSFISLTSAQQTGQFTLSNSDGKIRGVNIGGWLVLEPFITPSLFDQFTGQSRPGLDEWSFCDILGKTEATKQLIKHWDTFVTESDIQKLSAAGINRVRVPVGYWMWQNDVTLPYISSGLQQPFLLRLIQWCAKYNVKVHIDLHGAKGSQNGWNHSGKSGIQGWANHDNIYNTLSIIRSICEFAFRNSDPIVAQTIAGIELLNEPYGPTLRVLQEYYLKAYSIIRTYSPTVLIVMHDGYYGDIAWKVSGFYSKQTRESLPILTDDFLHANRSFNLYNVVADTHIYHIFVQGELYIPLADRIKLACGGDRAKTIQMKQNMGVETGIIVGEFSIIQNDCTKWLNGVGNGARYDGTFAPEPSQPVGQCTGDNGSDYTQWSASYKQFLSNFAQAQMSAYEQGGVGWFFWNFKTEASASQWNFLLGLEQG